MCLFFVFLFSYWIIIYRISNIVVLGVKVWLIDFVGKLKEGGCWGRES